MVDAARSNGFETALIYVALPSAEFAIERVAARVKLGGHNVPERKLRERWPRSLDNFITFMARIDDVLLFSNAGTAPFLVGERIKGGKFRLMRPDDVPEITRRLEKAGLILPAD